MRWFLVDVPCGTGGIGLLYLPRIYPEPKAKAAFLGFVFLMISDHVMSQIKAAKLTSLTCEWLSRFFHNIATTYIMVSLWSCYGKLMWEISWQESLEQDSGTLWREVLHCIYSGLKEKEDPLRNMKKYTFAKKAEWGFENGNQLYYLQSRCRNAMFVVLLELNWKLYFVDFGAPSRHLRLSLLRFRSSDAAHIRTAQYDGCASTLVQLSSYSCTICEGQRYLR